MNEILQSAQPLHPDADQLSAFAEQALPLHERQAMLAHLADCAHCRNVVFLAQQAEEEELPKEMPAASRKPWLSGWNLAWPAAAALACAGVATVKLRSLREAEHTAPPTVARVDELARPEAAPAPPPAIVAPPRPPLQATIPPNIAVPKPLPMVAAKAAPLHENDLPLDGRNIASLNPTSATAASGNAIHGAISGAVQGKPSAVVLGSAGAGSAQGQGAGIALSQQSATAANSSMAALRARVSVPAQTPQSVNGAQNYTQSAAAPAVKAAPQSVAVAAAPTAPPPPASNAEVTTADAAVSAVIVGKEVTPLAGGVVVPPVLPSHLAIRSSIANGGKTVAIDTNGQVFFSKDGGRKWQPVRVQWTGQAQRVSFDPSESKQRNPVQANDQQATSFSYTGDASGNHPVRLTIEHNRSLQDDFADIIGSVTDQTGAVIPGATVTVQEDVKEPTRSLRVTRTNAQGQYLLTAVPEGKLRLLIASPGFMTLTQTFEVVSRDRATFHSMLTVASASQTVEISAASSEIALDAIGKKKTRPAAFELTTDTGAVWTSTDGKKWKQK